jgi:hypothetical protein
MTGFQFKFSHTTILHFLQLIFQTTLFCNKKYTLSRNSDMAYYISRGTQHRPGGGRTRKRQKLEEFINGKIRYYLECGAPLTSEQLQALQQHISSNCDDAAEQNMLHKFISVVSTKDYNIAKCTH